MFQALGTCSNVQDFENLLDSTNVTGRRTHSNFGVIDSEGNAAIYETGGDQYWKYDANDTSQAPNGYVLRTNFTFNGGGDAGIERFNRTVNLMGDFYAGDSLNYKSILRTQMRDFSDYNSDPINVPYTSQWASDLPFGYINTEFSICRFPSISAVVIQGVLPEEPTILSTMWTFLGQPAASIAVPYWPVGDIPAAANGNPTAPLCDIANQIRGLLFDLPDQEYINTYRLRNEDGEGIWEKTFLAEDSIFVITDSFRNKWMSEAVSIPEMLLTESECANYALNVLHGCYNSLVSTRSSDFTFNLPIYFELNQNYPNPFNPSTTIEFTIPKSENVELNVYNELGQKVATLLDTKMNAGSHDVQFDASDLPSGIYFYRIQVGDAPGRTGAFSQVKKMVLLK